MLSMLHMLCSLRCIGDLLICAAPANAYATGFDNQGWKCNSSYTQSGNNCIKTKTSTNTYSSKTNDEYVSSTLKGEGFLGKILNKIGLTKKKIYIPANAYAYGSSWKCNSGYIKIDNSCIEDDKIYLAGSGTGFAATSDGHIVTNYHVINGCTQVAVHDQGKPFIATIITQDLKSDLAILKIDLKPSIIYPLSTDLYLTDDIFAAGYPFGKRVSSAVTINRGIISALMGPGDDISKFQIDAGLNPGNSGGPIVDKMGNALGVAVAKLDLEKIVDDYGVVPENVNFGVKANVVINIMESENIKLPAISCFLLNLLKKT